MTSQLTKRSTQRRPRQLALLKNEKSAYGGDLRNTRAGRRGARPLATRETMHLVLRSTKAKGDWSFRKPKNDAAITRIVTKFSAIYGVRLISMANVGNHLHLQIKLASRFTYPPFIRAVTGAIAMTITGRSRWTKACSNSEIEKNLSSKRNRTANEKFWDQRPFTRIVRSLKAFLNLKDYVRINQLEGYGYKRSDARYMLKIERHFAQSSE